MKSLKKLTGFGLIFFSLMLVISQSVIVSGTVQAQEPTPRPPPGGESGGSGSGGESGSSSSGSSVPLAPKTGLYGFVYNYSTAAYEPGVQVYADGDGWYSETVTDSNGYYHMSDLGFGKTVANLRLPADAHAAAPNWPVNLLATEGHQLDLGFYWRDDPPIPVLLSGIIAGDKLVVTIENNTDEAATGSLVEIMTPGSVTIEPAVKASQGQVAYAAHRTKVEPGQIMPGQTATISLPLGFENITAGQIDEPVQVLFTYNEQITPQALELRVSDRAVQTMASFDDSKADQPAAEYGADVVESPATENATGVPPVASKQTAEMEKPAATANSEKTTLLPETGNETQSVNLAIALLAALLMLVLGLGGWYSMRGVKR